MNEPFATTVQLLLCVETHRFFSCSSKNKWNCKTAHELVVEIPCTVLQYSFANLPTFFK